MVFGLPEGQIGSNSHKSGHCFLNEEARALKTQKVPQIVSQKVFPNRFRHYQIMS